MRTASRLALVLGLLVLDAPFARAQSVDKVALAADAQRLDVEYDGKHTTAGKLDSKLSPFVRQALNDWGRRRDAPEVRAGRAALGGCARDGPRLGRPVGAGDQGHGPDRRAVRRASSRLRTPARAAPSWVVLFDAAGLQSAAWPALLDELVARRDILPDFAESMKASPGSFTVRNSSLFVQHTVDIRGPQGLRRRRVPLRQRDRAQDGAVSARGALRAASRTCCAGASATSRSSGSTATSTSSTRPASCPGGPLRLPARTRELLLDHAKAANFSLAGAILGTAAAGTPDFGQQLAWGTLDYELAKEPAQLAALLGQLGALDREARPAVPRPRVARRRGQGARAVRGPRGASSGP